MKPNILFFLIDSFRADKCYGEKKTSITPNLDSLIKNGVYFSQNICSAAVTVPSVSSILTSLYPFEAIILEENHFKFNPQKTTYIKKLIESGYHAYAIIPELESKMGLDQVFKDNIETYLSSSTLYDGLGDKILSKLESNTLKEPWIYYLNFLDLHGSATFQLSEGPKEFQDEKYGINQYERMVSAMDVWIGKIIDKINLKNTLIVLTADHGSEVGIYTSEIESYRKKIIEYKPGLAYKTTHKIMTNFPEFLQPLRKKLSKTYTNRKKDKIDKRKNIEFEKIENKYSQSNQKRIIQHSVKSIINVYDDRFRVPLILTGYGINNKKIITHQVRSIDIFPTIAEIVGLHDQKNLGRGHSLIPIIQGQKFEEFPVLVDSITNSPKSATSDVVGIRTSQYKYFRDRTNPQKSIQLFDLSKDALEENNIASLRPEVIDNMEKKLLEIKGDGIFRIEDKKEVTDESENLKIEDELKKLGYI